MENSPKIDERAKKQEKKMKNKKKETKMERWKGKPCVLIEIGKQEYPENELIPQVIGTWTSCLPNFELFPYIHFQGSWVEERVERVAHLPWPMRKTVQSHQK